jgi:hypothetical protein
MTATKSYIDARAVARELLDGCEVAYGYPGDRDRLTRRLDLPDGRVATLALVSDDCMIGQWRDTSGKVESHSDDVFGVFQWRGKDSTYGYPSERPRDFDGRARVFTCYGQGCERIDGSVWWQPPADVAEADLPKLEKTVRQWLAGDWGHVGVVVSILDGNEEIGTDSLWGVDYGYPESNGSHLLEVTAECLVEAGIEDTSTAGVARWARDLLEALARRVSGEDPDDEDASGYHDAMRNVLAWWHEHVETNGDWDTYADGVVTRMEHDFANRSNLER